MMNWADWKPTEKAVLVFLRDGGNVLLIHKKRGLGKGKVNGPGGRLEAGETWEDAGIRETKEETGLTPLSLTAAADLRFQFTDGYALAARVFLAEGWKGTLTACEEADPFWQPLADIPWSQMWADDALWLPQVFLGHWVKAQFVFDGEKMKEANIEVRQRPSGPMNG